MMVKWAQNPEDSSGWIYKQGGCAHTGTQWHRAICLLSAPPLPPELPKLISRQHPKPITTSCFLQQSHQPSPPSRRCQSKVTSSFTVSVDLFVNAPPCPLLLCSAHSVTLHLKEFVFYLELFAQDFIWRSSGRKHPGDWSVCSLKLHFILHSLHNVRK